jgi:hypothetical protein
LTLSKRAAEEARAKELQDIEAEKQRKIEMKRLELQQAKVSTLLLAPLLSQVQDAEAKRLQDIELTKAKMGSGFILSSSSFHLIVALAAQHCDRRVLERFGLRPWKYLMSMKQQRTSEAVVFHTRAVLQRAINEWGLTVRTAVAERSRRAVGFCRRRVLAAAVAQWQIACAGTRSKTSRAQRFHESSTKIRALQSWG